MTLLDTLEVKILANASGLKSELAGVKAETSGLSTSFKGVAGDAENLGASLDKTESKAKGLTSTIGSNASAFGGFSSGAKQAATATEELGTKAEGAASKAKGLGAAFGGLGNIVAAGLGGAAVAIGAFAVKSAQDVDGAYSQMAKATGAQGTQLASLEASWNSVYSNVPESAGTVTSVIDQLNQSLRLNGDELTKASEAVINYSIATGTSASSNVTTFTKALNDANLGLEGAKKPLMTMPQLSDMFTVAFQKTGVSVSQIGMVFNKTTTSMTAMGQSIPQQIAMLSGLTAAGIPARQLASEIQKIPAAASKAHESSQQFFDGLIKGAKDGKLTADQIKFLGNNLESFKAAAKSGKLDNDELVNSITNSSGATEKAGTAMETFSERLTEFKNKLEVAFAPLGKTLITLLERLLDAITPMLPIITALVAAFTKLPMPIQLVGMALVGLVGGMGALNIVLGKFGLSVKSLPKDIDEKLIPSLKNLASDMSNVPSKVIGLGSKVGLGGGAAAGEAGAAEGAVGGALGGTTAEVGLLATIGPLLLPVVAIVGAIAAGFAILYATSGTFRSMVGGILTTFQSIVGWVGQLTSALMSGNFAKAGDLLKTGFQGAIDALTHFNWGEWAAKMIQSIKESLGNIGGIILGSLSSLSDIADKITSWLSNINWDQVINGLITAISGLFGGGGGGAGATDKVSTGMNKSLVDGATKAAPNILLKVVESLGRLSIALAGLLPEIGIALGKALLTGIGKSVTGINWSDAIAGLYKSLAASAAQFLQTILQLFRMVNWLQIFQLLFVLLPAFGQSLVQGFKQVDWGQALSALGTAIKGMLSGIGGSLSSALGGALGGIGGMLGGAAGGIGSALSGAMGGIGGALTSALSGAASGLSGVGAAVSQWVAGGIQWALGIDKAVISAVAKWVQSFVTWALGIDKAVVSIVAKWIQGYVTWALGIDKAIVSTVAKWIQGYVDWALGIDKTIVNAVTNFLQGGIDWGIKFLADLASGVTNFLTGGVDWGIKFLADLATAVTNWLTGGVNWGIKAVADVASIITSWVGSALTWGGKIADQVVSAVTLWVNGALAWGQQIVQWAQSAADILLGGQSKGPTQTPKTPSNPLGANPYPVPSERGRSTANGTIYVSESGPTDQSCGICNRLIANHPYAAISYGYQGPPYFQPPSGPAQYAAAGGIVGVGGTVGTYGTNHNGTCDPGYHFCPDPRDPSCKSCGVCISNDMSCPKIPAASGLNIGARTGGTHVIVGEGGETEAIIPQSLWGGDWSTVLNSLPRLAKGGIIGTLEGNISRLEDTASIDAEETYLGVLLRTGQINQNEYNALIGELNAKLIRLKNINQGSGPYNEIVNPFFNPISLQGGGNIGARAGGTHVIVGEGSEAEAVIPQSLWGGDWSTVLNSLPRLAKGGITGTGGFHDTSGTKTEEHTRKTEENTRKIEENTRKTKKTGGTKKLGKHPTQKQIDKYDQEQQLQKWSKSQLGGGTSAYYAPSRTADQEIEYLTAVALNTGETNAQLQKQINLVNTYYPLYGKAASSTIDVKGALSKLAADFATLPGGYKAGGATAATPGAWEDLKTHKWNYQTSDEEVAYLTELAVNTKETAAQLQKQINAAETYYKASGRDTSKISDATTLIAAYGAQTAANTAKAAAAEAESIKSLVSTVTSGITSLGDAVFNLMSSTESLKMLPQRFGGVLTNLDYYPPYTSQPEGSGTPQIVTALSGSDTAIGSNSVVSNLQQYGQAQITTNKSIFDGVMNLASTAGSSIMGVVSGLTNITGSGTANATKTDGSINTNGANLVSAVNNNTNSTSNAISNLSSVMGSGGSSGGSSGISGIISGIVDIFKGIFNLVTDISNTIAEQKQPTSGNFSYDGSYYITHSTKAPIDWGKIIGDVGTIFTGIGAVATGAMGMMGMQHGGIITRPTRVLAGEAGPEAVIPLNKVGSFGTQYTINMHVSGDENDAAVKRMADKVVKQIQRNELLQTGWY